MFKKSIIALVTLAAISGAALPALASTNSVFGGNGAEQSDNLKASVTQLLQKQGVKVNNIDEWDGYIRADVQLADGSTAVRFFQPGSLAPVSVDHLN